MSILFRWNCRLISREAVVSSNVCLCNVHSTYTRFLQIWQVALYVNIKVDIKVYYIHMIWFINVYHVTAPAVYQNQSSALFLCYPTLPTTLRCEQVPPRPCPQWRQWRNTRWGALPETNRKPLVATSQMKRNHLPSIYFQVQTCWKVGKSFLKKKLCTTLVNLTMPGPLFTLSVKFAS